MKHIFRSSMILIMFLVGAACSPAMPSTEPTPAALSVRIQLSSAHDYSSAPFYVAIRNEHFAANGIDTTLLEGGLTAQGTLDPIAEVVAGRATFGLADAVSILEARAVGSPIVAVASVLQRSPRAVISLQAMRIATPQDLVGHHIGVAAGSDATLLNALLGSQNIDPNLLTLSERTLSDGIAPLVNGEFDGLVGSIITEGRTLQNQGLDPQFILLSDYGIDTYDLVLFTTETMIRDQPNIVGGVVDALQSGITDVIANPAQAIDALLTYAPALAREEQLYSLEAIIPLMNIPDIAHGGMEVSIWQFIDSLRIDPQGAGSRLAIDQAFTLEFIPTNTP